MTTLLLGAFLALAAPGSALAAGDAQDPAQAILQRDQLRLLGAAQDWGDYLKTLPPDLQARYGPELARLKAQGGTAGSVEQFRPVQVSLEAWKHALLGELFPSLRGSLTPSDSALLAQHQIEAFRAADRLAAEALDARKRAYVSGLKARISAVSDSQSLNELFDNAGLLRPMPAVQAVAGEGWRGSGTGRTGSSFYGSLRTQSPPSAAEMPVIPAPVPSYVPQWAWSAYQAVRSRIGDTIGALGLPWNGSLKDGVTIPWEGDGFKFVRYGRWGTNSLVNGLQLVAKDLKEDGKPPLLIGDLSHKNGGPIRRHRSHQNGRDADIFFVTTDGRFDADRNLRIAVSAVRHMEVTNIFVDASLKALLARRAESILKGLSREEGKDIRRALALMSHEPHHMDHFHIRIK